MKRSGLIGIFFLSLSTSQLMAEPIVVRSGEHEDFTRIVLPLPSNSQWRLETARGLGTVFIENFSDGFDLSEAFEIIPRTRLSALLAQPSELQMQLTCDCSVEAFVEQDNFLVIDIRNGPPLEQNQIAPAISSQMPNSDFSYGQLLWSSDSASEAALEELGTSQTPKSESKPEESDEQLALDNQIQETKTELLEAFSTAVAQDLLELKDTPQTEPVRRDEPKTDTDVYDSSDETVFVVPGSSGNIRVTSSKDVPTKPIEENLDMMGAGCIEPDLVAISNWGSSSDPFGEQLSSSLDTVFDTFGRLDEDAVVRHAKLYLFFGFGAEAIKTLALAPNTIQKFPELVDLANIFEFGFAANPRILHRFAQCDSALALWGIIAADELPPSAAINTNAALLALQSLPAHLRIHVAQSLSERFLQRGDISSAAVAIRSYENLLENNPETPGMANAQLSKMRGDLQSSKETLQNIVSENTDEAPEAFFAIINNYVAENKRVPADMALLAETYAFEFKQSELGPVAYKSYIQATAKSGQLAKAFSAMRASNSEVMEKYDHDLSNFLISEATNAATDHEFLTLYFEYFDSWIDRLSPSVILDVATKLNNMGFFEEAENTLQNLPTDFQPRMRKLLEAKIHSKAERFDRALDVLVDLDGPDVFALKGEIYERIGINEAAADYFDDANLPERSVANMWLADGWADLINEDEPVFGSLVRLSNEAKPSIETDETMLTNSERAIEASADARASIEASLNALANSSE